MSVSLVAVPLPEKNQEYISKERALPNPAEVANLLGSYREDERIAGAHQLCALLSSLQPDDRNRATDVLLTSILRRDFDATREIIGSIWGITGTEAPQVFASSTFNNRPEIPRIHTTFELPQPEAPSIFVSQYRGVANPNEDATIGNTNCGPACLTMVARMNGHASLNPDEADHQIENARRAMGVKEDEYTLTGTEHLARGARELGLDAYTTAGVKPDDLQKKLGGAYNQAIVLLNPQSYGGVDRPHFVVVTQIDGDRVKIFDPADDHDPTDGGDGSRTISRYELEEGMRRTGGHVTYIKGGQREHLTAVAGNDDGPKLDRQFNAKGRY